MKIKKNILNLFISFSWCLTSACGSIQNNINPSRDINSGEPKNSLIVPPPDEKSNNFHASDGKNNAMDSSKEENNSKSINNSDSSIKNDPSSNKKTESPKDVVVQKKSKIQEPVKKEDIDIKNDSKDSYSLYTKIDDLVKPNLNFIYKNFKANKISSNENKWRKNYRLHQLFKNAIWNFNKKENKFSWSFDEQWITNMTMRDNDASNINLYLFVESITPDNTNKIYNYTRSLFKDYLNAKAANQWSNSVYSNYPLGIRLDWNKLKSEKEFTITTPKYFDIQVKYDSTTKNILFNLNAKKDIKFTDEPNLILDGKHVFISSPDNFLGISFDTNNSTNKSFKKFDNPSKAEEGVNVNAFDESTKSLDPNDNRYITFGEFKEEKHWQSNSLESELLTRSFRALYGSWTMLFKVKPSDNDDQRYYVMSNQHVFYLRQNNFDSQKKLINTIAKFVNDSTPGLDPFELKNPMKRPILSGFWGFSQYKNRWTNNLINNGIGPVKTAILNRDMQVSILDLNEVYKVIADNLTLNAKNKNKLDLLKKDFEKWPTLKPLEFTDRYKVINNFSTYLNDWLIVGYPQSRVAISQINKFRTVNDGSNPQYKGENNKFVAYSGNSGSLIVSRDRKIVGIHAIDPDDVNWREGQFFYSFNYDSIGSNVDGSDPSQNNNPTTFGKAVIEANKLYPNKFELLNIFKDKSSFK